MCSVKVYALLVFISNAVAQSGPWGQCGGNGWTGPKTCQNGWVCKFSNDWYSQCLPGTSTSSINLTGSDVLTRTSSTRPPISSTTTYQPPTTTSRVLTSTLRDSTSTTTVRVTSTTTRSNPQTTAPGSLPTLKPGYLWIRGVTAPNFHYYIQANSVPAVLGTNFGAGQFAIVSGQLTQLTSSGEILYAQVEAKTSADDLLLGLSFASTPNTNGAFAWSGDSLTWSSSGITRPNPAAWYVCGTNRDLFINLGQYLYGTPAGCTDHTIHYYNDATPNA